MLFRNTLTLLNFGNLALRFFAPIKKSPSHNERFGASGGVVRPTLCVGQHSPLSSKPLLYPACRQAAGRCAPAGDTVQVFSGDFDSVYFDSFVKISFDFCVAHLDSLVGSINFQ